MKMKNEIGNIEFEKRMRRSYLREHIMTISFYSITIKYCISNLVLFM